jgi:hypothetical protein
VARGAQGVLVLNKHDYNLFSKLVNYNKIYKINCEGYSVPNISSSSPKINNNIVMVSRLIKEKGVFQYLEAVKILRNQAIQDGFKFYLVGKIDITHKIDNEKMSKSVGNFITMEDAITLYPKKSLIMCLIEAGDGTNDANVRISDIPVVTKSLEKTFELIKRNDINYIKTDEWLNEYAQEIRECLVVSTEAWKRGRIREAITYGWRKALKAFETYRYNSHPSTGELNYYALSLISCTLKFLSKTNDQDDFTVMPVDFTPILTLMPNEDIKKLAEYLNQLKKFNGKGSKLIIHHGIINRPGNRERITEFLKDVFPDWQLEICVDETIIHEKRDPYKVKPLVV